MSRLREFILKILLRKEVKVMAIIYATPVSYTHLTLPTIGAV